MKKRGAERNTQVPQSSHCDYPKRSRHRQLLSALLLLLVVAAGASINAQVCTLIPNGGGESISAQITIQSTGAQLANGAVVPTGTSLRLDAVATADGSCSQVGPGCFGEAQRTVNHINVQSDISTAGGLNGHYVEGYVFGWDENHITAYYHELDTHSSNSTGPLYTTLFAPGTYQFHLQLRQQWQPHLKDRGAANNSIHLGFRESAGASVAARQSRCLVQIRRSGAAHRTKQRRR